MLCDDAYFGLFYHLGGASMTESLFGKLTGRHPNLLAVKLDGATKELFVWGLRCGFITFGPGRADCAAEVCEALDAKTRGAIRGGISNVPQLSQTLVERTLQNPDLQKERDEKCETLRVRAERVYEVANRAEYQDSWSVYPFNRLLHAGEGERRRRGEAPRPSPRRAPGRSDRDVRDGHPRGVQLPRRERRGAPAALHQAIGELKG